MARSNPSVAPAEGGEGQVQFSLLNWVLLAAAVVAIVAGFFLLSGGSTIAAPLLLVLGYVILMPLGIIL
ncbi:MAG TPA: hypothetical protein VF167_11955 [Longimicrobiaceae bacterium]